MSLARERALGALRLPTHRAASPTLFHVDGGIEVHIGDCREVLPRRLAELGLRAADVALVHADPPYGTGEHFDRERRGRGREPGSTDRGRLVGGRGRPHSRDWPPMAGNDRAFDPSHLLHYPRIVFWGANHFSSRLPDSRAWLYWDKRGATGSNDGSDGELAWTNLRAPLRRFAHLWRGVCRASETGTVHLGPTQKPVALVEWVFRDRAKLRAGDLVLVPYCGSGPELVVCRRMHLRCIAVDIDPLWCETAVRERLVPSPDARGRVRIAAPPPRLRMGPPDAAPLDEAEATVESEMPSSEERTRHLRRARWA